MSVNTVQALLNSALVAAPNTIQSVFDYLSPFREPLFKSVNEFSVYAAKTLQGASSSTEQPALKSTKNELRVLHVGLEGIKAQVGGLGAFIQAIVPAQNRYSRLGKMNAASILPYYGFLEKACAMENVKAIGVIEHVYKKKMRKSTIFKTDQFGSRLFLVKPDPSLSQPSNMHLFQIDDPNKIYNRLPHSTLMERMCYFASAVASFAAHYEGKLGNKSFDVIHYHSWPVALGAPVLKEVYQPRLVQLGISIPKIVSTIHSSLEPVFEPVLFHVAILLHMGLKRANYDEEIEVELETSKHVDSIISVSHTLLGQACTVTQNTHLRAHYCKARTEGRFIAITNGIHRRAFHPLNNERLGAFTLQEGMQLTFWKKSIKEELVRRNILASSEKPLFIFIGRFSEEKGIDMLPAAKDKILQLGGSFVVMGQQQKISENNSVDEHLKKLAQETSPHFRLIQTKSEQEMHGHLVRAAADFFIVPSHYEACGLVPMEGFCVGALAITSNATGFNDFIDDFDKESKKQKNGFMYESDLRKEVNLSRTIERAYRYFTQLSTDEKNKLQSDLMSHSEVYDWDSGTHLDHHFQIYQ